MSVEQLETIRARIVETTTELESIQRALVPLDVALEKLQAWIARKGKQFSPVAHFALMNPGATGSGLDEFLDAARPGERTQQLCWLWPEQVYKRLAAHLESHYADTAPTTMSEDERQAAIDQLTQRLYELECEEERLVRSLEDAGQHVVRRGDVHHLEVVVMDMAD